MAATTSRLLTVAEFRALPLDDGPARHELRQGEVVSVTRPKYRHALIQRRLRRLLENLAPAEGVVDTEFAYRPLPEYELRVADVAYVSGIRERAIDPEDNLQGAPDITIEVLSPSNTAAEIYDKEKLCLENGAQEFWVVDPDRRQVKVSRPDGHTVTWRSGQEIPLRLFGNVGLSVDAIFG
jgi:Uma2 family endonuclease